MIDRDALRERGTLVCSRLNKAVEQVTPPGIGRWDRAWDIVAGADADFMVALTAWEADPCDATRELVKHTFAAVLDAWRRAVAEFNRERASR
ncbi:MAG: hypothetical protein ABL963_06860 [Longimicrobiales bacterium]